MVRGALCTRDMPRPEREGVCRNDSCQKPVKPRKESFTAHSGPGWTRRKKAGVHTALLEPLPGPTRARIIAAQLFFQELIRVDDPHASLDVRFAGETPYAVSTSARRTCSFAFDFPPFE